ncbi:MAG TPA: hypothetical protein VK255_01995 [Patescibacteria group bacterium]|nr:hypothetical protein [Patescibacteria group bacterium]
MKFKEEIDFLAENQSSWEGKTPCFVIDKKKLECTIEDLKKNLKGEIAYSHKTNPDPIIIKTIFDNGCNFLVSSVEEMRSLKKLTDVSPERIIFQSPSLTKEQYNEIRQMGVYRLSIDSVDQLDMILEDVGNKINGDGHLELLVRINTGVKVKNPELPYSSDSYLGFPLKEAVNVFKGLSVLRERGLVKLGIHNHLLSQNTYLDMWQENLDVIAKYLIDLKRMGIEIDLADFGGGYPVEYHTAVPELSEISKMFDAFQEKIAKVFPNMHYIFEPGRKTVAESVHLVAKVAHTKKFLGQDVAILNCSVYSHSLDTLIVDLHLPGQKIEKGVENAPVKNYVVRGSTPDSLDVFSHKIDLPELKNGDYIGYLRCGAYSFGCNFISLDKSKCIDC